MSFATSLDPAVRAAIVALSLSAMGLEFLAARRAGRPVHDLRETAVTAVVALGQGVLRLIEGGLLALPFLFVWEHRLATIDLADPLALPGLFVAFEFLYYWHHRASHRIRWFWATHAVHHSTTRFNLTAALRLGWTGNLSGHFLFYLPLVWIGFPPLAVIAMLAIDLAYQFFVHTELLPDLGPLEWILNTPRHHAVHHAANPECIDRNYGGMVIVFDRLFGTFAEPPAAPLRFGLVGHEPATSPLAVVFGAWISLFADLRRARSPRAGLATLFGPP